MRNKIDVFDTTLRDGAQTPFIGMDFWDRYIIAKALADTGVDVIEVGFAANEVDFESMRRIAKYIGNRKYSRNKTVPVVCSLARVLEEDVKLAFEAIEPADPDKRRIHVFIGTSEELMSYSHGKREEEILNLIEKNVGGARGLGDVCATINPWLSSSLYPWCSTRRWWPWPGWGPPTRTELGSSRLS